MKRIGGSGGLHIHRLPGDAAPRPAPLLPAPRRGRGDFTSWASSRSASSAFAVSRQWTSPLAEAPLPLRRRGRLARRSTPISRRASSTPALALVATSSASSGLVSFDFLVDDGEPTLLEVNPRPGATHRRVRRRLGHACSRPTSRPASAAMPPALLQSDWRPPVARAAAFLYADRGALTVPRHRLARLGRRPPAARQHHRRAASRSRPSSPRATTWHRGREHLPRTLGASRKVAV